MKLSRKSLPILLTLNKLNSYFSKLYCFPSQEKLLSLLSKFTSLQISRRQLNYDLSAMEKSGMIIRIKRHRKSESRGMEFRSTLYKITLKGYNLLLRSKVITFSSFKAIKKAIEHALLPKRRPCAKKGYKSNLTSISNVLKEMQLAPE